MRLKRMNVTPELLVAFIKGEALFYEPVEPMPKDLKLVNIEFDHHFEQDQIWMLLESSEFEDVSEAGFIPRWNPKFKEGIKR